MLPSPVMSSPFEEAGPEQSTAGLSSYLDVIRRRKWLVLAVTAVAVAAAAALSLLSKPVYRAETKIVIGQGGGLVQPGFANSIQPYTATMSDLITSDIVASNVIKSLGLKQTPHELLAKISTSINPQTAVLNVYVDDHDRSQAVRIDQQVAVVFSQLVADRFGHTAAPTTPGTAPTPPLTANVFDPAHALPGRVSPKPVQNVIIALVLGLVLGLISAFLREHFDRALRTRDDVERAFGVPVIAQVPFPKQGKEQRTIAWDGMGETAEAFRGLRANLQYLAVQRPLRTILVTSASPEQGKTTVAANLGVTIARSGASAVVVDADLRRPRLGGVFGAEQGDVGLTNVLVGSADLQAAIREVPLPDGRDEAGRLAFIPSGPLPPNPSELLASAQMTALLDRLSAAFEYVIIDSPPVLLVADALELARNADGALIVARRSASTTDDARELRATFGRLGIHLVGVVFTDAEPLGSYGGYEDRPATKPPARPRRKRGAPEAERQPEPVSAEEV
jgi:capsular exopolysaccharide synthesis family protein